MNLGFKIGIAFSAIFISFLWFRRKLGKAKESEQETENETEEQTVQNVTLPKNTHKTIYRHLSENSEIENPENRLSSENAEKNEIQENEEEVAVVAPIVTLNDLDGFDDNFVDLAEKDQEEFTTGKIQESNISEILENFESKDEKKDSAFETSESEAETRETRQRYSNEIVGVTELTLEKPRFKDIDPILSSSDGLKGHKRDSGTISPTLSAEIIEAKAARYQEDEKAIVSQKKSGEKINEKLKATLERMFDDEGELEEDIDFSDDDGMRGAIKNNNSLIPDFKPSDNPPLIVDVGSMWTRMGFSSDDAPTEVQRTMIGELRRTLTNKQQTYYGQDVVSRSGILKRREPVMSENVNWSDVCELVEFFASNRYNIDLSDQPITLSSNHDKKSRRGAVQQLFESRHAPGVNLASQAACGLFGSGYTSGIVAHGGHRGIEVVPVYEGASLHHARSVTPGGGEQMTENLRVYMRDECAAPMNTFSEVEFLRMVCENHASFYRPEFCPRPAKKKVEFELPDGNTLNFRDGIRRCTENILPAPDVYDQILSRCDRDLLNAGVFSTCIMSGGMSKIENYSNCIKGDLQVALNSLRKDRNLWQTSETLPYRLLNIVTSDDASNLSWRGASAISCTSNFSQSTITKEMYAEFGDSIVDRFH